MCDFELCLSGVFMHFMNFRAEAIFWDTKGHVPSTIFAAAHFCRDYKPNWSAQRVEKNVCLHVKHYTSSALFLHDQALQSDPRFRKYNQLIEKNLNSFDAVNEWADIISFLGRLLKVKKRKRCSNGRLICTPCRVSKRTLNFLSYLENILYQNALLSASIPAFQQEFIKRRWMYTHIFWKPLGYVIYYAVINWRHEAETISWANSLIN